MFVASRHNPRAFARATQYGRCLSTIASQPQSRSRVSPFALSGFAGSVVLGAGLIWASHDKEKRSLLRADSGKHGNETPSRQVVVLDTPPPIAPPVVEQEPQPASYWSFTDWTSLKDKAIPDWATVKDKLTDTVLPGWAKQLPDFFTKLQDELSAAPGSLADDIWKEAHDPTINPEIVKEAFVRVSPELCDDEKAFLRKRKLHTRRALARYLGVHETEIHPDDVPTIAMCGSGGGLRALVAGTSSYLSAQEAGLFDCVTYTAGVSGSCWLQSLYYSSITGQRHDRLIEHLKRRLNVHIAFPPPLLTLLTTLPTSKYLLSGGFEKYKGVEDADLGLVDIYGVMLGARLLVPSNELAVNDLDLKISNQRRFVDGGAHPLPIYTAVRHDIPREQLQAEMRDNNFTELDPKVDETAYPALTSALRSAAAQAYRPDFEWFEWTPYEFFCEDFGAGIPTWSMGRKFSGGSTVWRDDGMSLPELRLPLLMGIFGSAFCATLSHYYKEIRPIVQGLAGLGILDETLTEQDEELIKIHPIDPAQVPNFVLGMRDRLPASCPESVHDAKNIQLMDAGMSNNLPIYPLLRPGRDVDILITFDASADVRKDNWLKVAEGYAKQRGIAGWPVGSGWPLTTEPAANAANEANKPEQDHPAPDQNEPPQEEQLPQFEGQDASEARLPLPRPSPSNPDPSEGSDLGYCTVWLGDRAAPDIVYSASSSTSPHAHSPAAAQPPLQFRQSPSSSSSSAAATASTVKQNGFLHRTPHDSAESDHKDDKDDDASKVDTTKVENNPLHSPTAGLAMIYFPLIPNPAVPSIDPQKSDFMSTWNFVYTPEQVDDVVELARANFREGEELVREVVRGVWERKRAMRLGQNEGVVNRGGEAEVAHMG